MARGRKHAPGGRGSQPSNYQREVETYNKRLEVINFHDANDMSATLSKFYQHLTTKSKKTIEKEYMSGFKTERVSNLCVRLQLRLEESLVEWAQSLREEGVPVSGLMLQLKAQAVAEVERVPAGVFEGSWVWQRGFLRRHGLSLRAKTRQGQNKPAAMEAEAVEFWKKVAQVKAELGVEKIYNADQSGVCFEYLPKKTIDKRGAETAWVRCGGKDKERIRGMFMADSTGEQYTPFLVMKTKPSSIEKKAIYNDVIQNGFGNTLWKEMATLSQDLDVQIYGNASAWWTSDLSVRFLDYHFADREESGPVLLLLDDFSAHWTDEVLEHAELLSVHLVRVPPGLTSVCQPADISWFRPFKQRLRKEWVNELTAQLRAHHEQREGVPFKLVAPSHKDAITWAMKSWKGLGTRVIKSGFSGLSKCAGEQVPGETNNEAIFPETDLVEALERLDAVEDTIDDSDDIIDRYMYTDEIEETELE